MKMTSLLKVDKFIKIEQVVKRKEIISLKSVTDILDWTSTKKTLSKALSSLVLFLLGQVFEVRHQLFCGDKSQHQVVSWAWLSEGCQIARCWGDDDDDNVDGNGDGDGDCRNVNNGDLYQKGLVLSLLDSATGDYHVLNFQFNASVLFYDIVSVRPPLTERIWR